MKRRNWTPRPVPRVIRQHIAQMAQVSPNAVDRWFDGAQQHPVVSDAIERAYGLIVRGDISATGISRMA